MVSKNQIKTITALQQKKYRMQQKLFFAEGIKVVQELLNSNFELNRLFTVEDIFTGADKSKTEIITHDELKKISALTTPNTALAIFAIPDEKPVEFDGLIMALDDVRDPGNIGTIIRLCDWFGIKHLICSENCADIYNPKVVQATMGSLSRVNIIYTDLAGFIQNSPLPVFGTFIEGDNVYKTTLPQNAVMVMGNEANGISEKIEDLLGRKLAIPRFGSLQQTESLNVATAAAILLSEFRRDFSEM